MVTISGVRDVTLPTVADILSTPVRSPDTLRIFCGEMSTAARNRGDEAVTLSGFGREETLMVSPLSRTAVTAMMACCRIPVLAMGCSAEIWFDSELGYLGNGVAVSLRSSKVTTVTLNTRSRSGNWANVTRTEYMPAWVEESTVTIAFPFCITRIPSEGLYMVLGSFVRA